MIWTLLIPGIAIYAAMAAVTWNLAIVRYGLDEYAPFDVMAAMFWPIGLALMVAFFETTRLLKAIAEDDEPADS